MVKHGLGKRYHTISNAHEYIKGERLKARDYVLSSILPSAEYEISACLCTGDNDYFLSSIDRFGLPIQAVLCKICGLIRLSPRWDEKTYIRIYKEAFWPLQIGIQDLNRDRFMLSVRRSQPFANKLSQAIELSGKRILEIGCSYGAGLYKIKDYCRDVVGYDYDEKILESGRYYSGLNLKSGGLDQAIKDGNQYDVVILRHVLEHFLDPVESLNAIKRLLVANGFLFVEVPGVLGVNRWQPDPLMMFNAFHTYYFSLETLSHIMLTAGFSLVHGDEHVYSTWKLSKVEKTIAFSPELAKNILLDIKKVERRRKWNTFYLNFEAGVSKIKKRLHS